jgi:Flagellar biogenesis protein
MGDACGMRSICLAILFAALSAAMAGASVSAGEITGKGFPISSAPTTQLPVKQVETASKTTPVANAAVTVTQPRGIASFEEQPMQFSATERRRARTGEQREFRLPSILPALFCVLVVCAIFVAVLYVIKKYLPGHRQMFAHPAMEFLGRTHLDQRRFVSILRVGRRIVVVGVSPDEMHTLSEITDEAEVTEILEVARPKTETGLTMFQKLFQRNVVDVEAAEAKAEAEARVAELDEQMSSIREHVKNIREDEKKKPAAAVPAGRRLDAVG